jgi:hypothetical protein
MTKTEITKLTKNEKIAIFFTILGLVVLIASMCWISKPYSFTEGAHHNFDILYIRTTFHPLPNKDAKEEYKILKVSNDGGHNHYFLEGPKGMVEFTP